MKTILLAASLLITSLSAIAETTYYSDGSFSQTTTSPSGGSTTYNSNGSNSQTTPNGSGGSTTYNSNGTFSTSTGY